MSYSQQNNVNILNQTLTLVQNNYHFHIAINERDSVKEKIEKIQEQFHSIEKDIEIGDGSDLNKKFKEIWQAISYLIEYGKLVVSYHNKEEEYTNYFNMIKSIYAIIDLYRTHCQNFNVDIKIIDSLKKLADDLFEKCSKELDENFLFRYKLYHYLNSKKLSSIYCHGGRSNWRSNYQQILEQYQNERYNKEELMKFFDENAEDLLLNIINYQYDRMNSRVNKFEFYFILENICYRPCYRPFYCFDNEQQAFAFMMYIEMEKLNELYQSLEHHGKDILNG